LRKKFVIPLEVGLRYIFYAQRSAMSTKDNRSERTIGSRNTEYIYTVSVSVGKLLE